MLIHTILFLLTAVCVEEAELTVHGRITSVDTSIPTLLIDPSRARCPTNHVHICSLLMSAREQRHSQSAVLCVVEPALAAT